MASWFESAFFHPIDSMMFQFGPHSVFNVTVRAGPHGAFVEHDALFVHAAENHRADAPVAERK